MAWRLFKSHLQVPDPISELPSSCASYPESQRKWQTWRETCHLLASTDPSDEAQTRCHFRVRACSSCGLARGHSWSLVFSMGTDNSVRAPGRWFCCAAGRSQIRDLEISHLERAADLRKLKNVLDLKTMKDNKASLLWKPREINSIFLSTCSSLWPTYIG